MDDKLMSTIDKIARLTQQNVEFDTELRKRLNVASAKSVLLDDERIKQIHEYCIEEIIRRQASEFYVDFPFEHIKATLIEDFVRMESFRRKDDFGDFCLALYQQIECVTNELCEMNELSLMTEKMWNQNAYIESNKNEEPSIYNRKKGEWTIAKLLFRKEPENKEKPLQKQFALDKIRIIVYFFGYKAMMKSSDFNSYNEIISLLNDIYQCRNMNHRGNSHSQYQKEIIDKIKPLKSLYYLKFLGALAQYVEFIKDGYVNLPKISDFCKTI